MKVVVTGAAGFIGTRLARALAARGELSDAQDQSFSIRRLVLADSVLPEADASDPRIEAVRGDIGDPAFVSGLIDAGTRVVFHLAGVMSGAAENDFALGMRVNLDGTRNVLEACRALPRQARLVYTSSIGVFGRPLPPRIDDQTPQRSTCPMARRSSPARSCSRITRGAGSWTVARCACRALWCAPGFRMALSPLSTVTSFVNPWQVGPTRRRSDPTPLSG